MSISGIRFSANNQVHQQNRYFGNAPLSNFQNTKDTVI